MTTTNNRACFGIGCTRHTCCQLYAAIEHPRQGQMRIPSCDNYAQFQPITVIGAHGPDSIDDDAERQVMWGAG